MLTIQNYHNIIYEPVGDGGWKVWEVNEHADTYEFVLANQHQAYHKSIQLERHLTRLGNGRMSYRISGKSMQLTGNPAPFYLHISYLNDMENMLNSLEKFVR